MTKIEHETYRTDDLTPSNLGLQCKFVTAVAERRGLDGNTGSSLKTESRGLNREIIQPTHRTEPVQKEIEHSGLLFSRK